MKLARKLNMGFVAVAFLVAVTGIFGLVVSRQIVGHFEEGDKHYRAVVSNATAASRYAKDAQSALVVYLLLNDPGERENYLRGISRLSDTVALLDGQVRIPKARRIVETMKAKLAVFQAQCDTLLERYDRESARGAFLPRNHALLFREMNRTGSSIRQDGVDLAAVETDFLNKQTAITAATLVSSYAKRAEGHLMVYLALQNPEEREVFGKRVAALKEQVAILQDRVEDGEGKAILSEIRAGTERLLLAGNSLLASLEGDKRTTGSFNPEAHQDLIREVHRAASDVQVSGNRLADHSIRLEKESDDRAVRQANSIAYSILLVAGITVLLAVAFGYFFSRRIAVPLKQLGDAAARIGKGDLDAKIARGGSDEIGDLARSIRRMRIGLKTTMVSRDQVENVLQSMNDCLAVVDLDGRVRTVNRALCDMLGYVPEDLQGRPAARLFGENGGILDPLRKELLEAGHFRNVEKTCHAKDGREIAVLLSGALMRNPAGQPQSMVFVAKDIRERKRAEEELRLSEERFRQLFEQTHEPLLLFPEETGGIADANPAAVELYGYSRDELVAGGPALFVPPEDLEEFSAAIRGIGPGHSISVEKATHVRRGGEKRFVSIKGKSILLRSGRITYCTVRDITERIRMEEEARHQQARLIHANRMASLGAVVSGVAHEVNNPNNQIMFNTPIILAAWQDATRILDRHHREPGGIQLAGLPYSEMRETISRMILGISESSLRIRNIVANLKGFARQEEDTRDSVVDVNEAVRSVVAILNHEIMKGTRRFRATFGAECPTVMGSAAQLEQVLMNLILNSIQSLPDPARAVEVMTGIDFGTGIVEIRVRDEGTGIPPDILGKITDPFFTTKHASGGLGLGLSISRAIVEKHGGELNFRSVVGQGTEAIIALPLAGRVDKIHASA
jgi:PAS domain S-box-containing protein